MNRRGQLCLCLIERILGREAGRFPVEWHEMNIDNAVKLIDAVTKLLGVMLWPAVVIFMLVRFGAAFRDFIASMGEFSLKGGALKPLRRARPRRLRLSLPQQRPTPSPARHLKPRRGTRVRQPM